MNCRFQQDPIEEHFGHQRANAGCSYRVTPLQFTQTERKLTNLSSLNTASTSTTSREKKKSLEWNERPFKNLELCDVRIETMHTFFSFKL